MSQGYLLSCNVIGVAVIILMVHIGTFKVL